MEINTFQNLLSTVKRLTRHGCGGIQMQHSSSRQLIKSFIGNLWTTAQEITETVTGGRQKSLHSHRRTYGQIN